MSQTIALKVEVKPLKVNEGSMIRSRDFGVYIENPEKAKLRFNAALANGGSLPDGLEMSEAGVLSGIPGPKTARDLPYPIRVYVDSSAGSLEFDFSLYIFKTVSADEIKAIKESAWRELVDKGILPENMQEVINRPVTSQDVYHLLERFATFTVWNADDLRLADKGEVIQLGDASKHYAVYDFDVCLVATPKELYSHDRVMGDALATARAMVREVHRRGWHVEFGGFDRMATAAWYEVRKLNAGNKHQMEVRNYQPAEIKAAKKKATPASGG